MKRLVALLTIPMAYVAALTPGRAHAYPELTRFGYNTCMACHVAPTGGGLLTPYGRKLSAELMNTWGEERHAGVFWGAVDEEKLEDYLLLGGDIRAAQVHFENERVKAGRFIKMQADVAAAAVHNAWTFLMRVGKIEDEKWRAIANEFWAKWSPTESLSVRAGRFTPAYGLRLADHIAFVRGPFGFGLDSARDAAELGWFSETWSAFATVAKEFRETSPERTGSLIIERAIGDTSKIGANVLIGDNNTTRRDLAGVWGIAGFSKRSYWLTELDWQTSKAVTSQTAFATYQRLGYTVFKGLDLNVLYERYQADVAKPDSITERAGPGFQFTPLAHTEFSGAWTKQRTRAPKELEEDYAWLVLHYYF